LWSRSPNYNPPIEDLQQESPIEDSQQQEEELDDKGKGFVWTIKLEALLFNELVRQVVDLGKRADSGFKKEAWKEVVARIYSKAGHQISVDKAKNKVDTLRQHWRGFNYLKDQSGFGYNEEIGLFEAEDRVWEAIIELVI
jgi:hypothetical protein